MNAKRKITGIQAVPLATGIQAILLDMKKDGIEDPSYSIKEFERMIMDQHGVSHADAERVTEKVIATGIIRWEIFANNFVL